MWCCCCCFVNTCWGSPKDAVMHVDMRDRLKVLLLAELMDVAQGDETGELENLSGKV